MKPSDRIIKQQKHFELINGMDRNEAILNAIVSYLDEEYEKNKPIYACEIENIDHKKVPCEKCKRIN